jgi:predicted 3-demethylubiquinone-9 3-methyltransferase (glyoxalase superfamily)
MHEFTTFLWFEDNAHEAVKFYTELFAQARLVDSMPGPGGVPLTLTFELGGQRFTALNGGPHYKLTPAVSIFVTCETQAEIDRLWEALSAGGTEMSCGWLTDRFGLSWQIVPANLMTLLTDADPGRAQRAMQAMLATQTKFDMAALERAANGT